VERWGGDDYPSFSTAIRATKNRRRSPNNEETHDNQPKESVGDGGGGVMMRCDHGGTYGGDDFMSFGAANNATKN
jgi:hypothetical protein